MDEPVLEGSAGVGEALGAKGGIVESGEARDVPGCMKRTASWCEVSSCACHANCFDLGTLQCLPTSPVMHMLLIGIWKPGHYLQHGQHVICVAADHPQLANPANSLSVLLGAHMV